MNSEKILNNILRLNFNIKNKFHQKTEFENKTLEEEFQDYLYNTSINKNLASNLVIFLGYLATILFIIIAFPKKIYFINCTTCFLLSVISLIISSIYKSKTVYFINDHIQIFLSSFEIICKGYFLCLMFNTIENDNVEELLRIIIYNFFSTNIFLITKLEANIFVSSFYFLLNFSLIVIGSVNSIKNRNYFLEAFTSFCTFLIFYALRKQWDYRIRLNFAEKQKFEKYYFYTLDYLDGLNGFNINVQNCKMIFYGKKFNSLVSELVEDKFLYDLNSNPNGMLLQKNTKISENEIISAEINQKMENMKNISYNIQEKNCNESIMYFDEYEFNNTNKDNLIISLLKNLFYFKSYNSNNILMDNLHINETHELLNDEDKQINECIEQKNFSLYKFIFQNKNNQYSQNNESKIINNNTINEDILENQQINKKENNLIKINIEICEAFNKKSESEKQNYEIVHINNKKKNIGINSYNETPINDIKSTNEKSKKINNELNRREDKTKFQSIGIYYMENPTGKKLYYNILQRKIFFQQGNKIDNFFFQDVTDLVNYQINQHEENIKKQKIFAKISHEFKTPLNSIIGTIGIIKNSEEFFSESVNNYLGIISNLSNYVIYLVSDIIQYVNFKSLNDIKVIMSDINFKDILKFSFKTLNSLISCNHSKIEKINSYLHYEQTVEDFIAESDENRLKQIILNFISNAVKFTREGSIYLKCKLKNLKNQFFIKISVKDTGIGIKKADKNKLFKDFGLIENQGEIINNNFGTGLGLSICKSLVEKLELKLEFQSEHLKGSKFSVLIPCKRKGTKNYDLESPDIILLNEKKSSLNDDPITFINVSMNEILYDEKSLREQEIILRKSNEGPYEIKNKKSNLDIDKSFEHKLNNKRLSTIHSKKSLKSIYSVNSNSEFDKSQITLLNENTSFLKLDDYQKYFKDKAMKDSEIDKKIVQFDIIKKNIIVLADDNHLINNCNQKILSDILNEFQRNDFEIICVNDGIDVLKIFLNNENTEIFKLLITDENMDFMNGSDSIKVIRKIEDSKNIKKLNIISLTCHEDLNIRDMIIKAGADFILTKPLSKPSIKSLIEKNNLLF